jgi:triacylglycerol lipase
VEEFVEIKYILADGLARRCLRLIRAVNGRRAERMAIADKDAVDYGYLVAFAEGMYVADQIVPRLQPRIAALGFDVIGHLIAQDVLIPALTAPTGQRKLSLRPITVFFGFLARSQADPNHYVAAVRGTNGFAEWAINGEFLSVPWQPLPGATVEQGFSDIYGTMTLVGANGAQIGIKAADGIAQVVAGGTVTVCGHSLGAALATYLSFDVAGLMGNRASACLFASPRTGDSVWTNGYKARVQTYRLINYVLDIVPYVPFEPPAMLYQTLPGTQILEPNTAQAEVRFDISANHNLLSYCAMLDSAEAKRLYSSEDAQTWKDIFVPPRPDLNYALIVSLARAADALGGEADHIAAFLWATMHSVNA